MKAMVRVLGSVLVLLLATSGCSATQTENVGSSADALSIGAVTSFQLPTVMDAYNTSLGVQVSPTGNQPMHLGTFTFNDPDRRIGYVRFGTGAPFVFGDSTGWGTPQPWTADQPFAGWIDSAQVLSIPNSGNIQTKGLFAVVAGVSDTAAHNPITGQFVVDGVAVIATNNGGATWSTPQLIHWSPACEDLHGVCASLFFSAQLVPGAQPGAPPELYVSYKDPYLYDPKAPYGWYMERWQLNLSTLTFHKVGKIPTPNYNNQADFPKRMEFNFFRFAVGTCQDSTNTKCVFGRTVIVGIAPDLSYFPTCDHPTTHDVKWRAIAWQQGDKDWTDLGVVSEDLQLPNCLANTYRVWQDAAITMDPRLSTVVIAIPKWDPDLGLGLPYGMRIELTQTMPFDMTWTIYHTWAVDESPWAGIPPLGDVEYDDIAPSLLFNINVQTGEESFGMNFLSNSDYTYSQANLHFGGVRVLAVDSGAFLPPVLPKTLGAGQVPPYNATSTNYELWARTIGLDSPTCGSYESFHADPNGPMYLVPFTP